MQPKIMWSNGLRVTIVPVFTGLLFWPMPGFSAEAWPLGASPVDAALETLERVCRPALEQQVAPRISAEKLGMAREASVPAVVLSQFPFSLMVASAVYSAPVAGGRIYVASTVIPPPASPYSCAVLLDVDAPGLVERVTTAWSAPGSAYATVPDISSPDQTIEQRLLRATKGKRADNVLAVRVKSPAAGKPPAFVLTYRVDEQSLRAAGSGNR